MSAWQREGTTRCSTFAGAPGLSAGRPAEYNDVIPVVTEHHQRGEVRQCLFDDRADRKQGKTTLPLLGGGRGNRPIHDVDHSHRNRPCGLHTEELGLLGDLERGKPPPHPVAQKLLA